MPDLRASQVEAASLVCSATTRLRLKKAIQVKESDLKRVEAHLKRTFNHGGIKVKARKVADSAEVYVDDEFIGVVFEDEDEAGSFMFEMAILSEDLAED